MRNVVHAARVLILAVLLAAGLPARRSRRQENTTRVIITPDADYPGFDYETVKDVDLEACEAACIGGDQCRAFTYNTKARWCFLKTDFGTLTATPGRHRRPPRRDRRADPEPRGARASPSSTSCPAAIVDEARALAATIKRRYVPPAAPPTRRSATQGTGAYNAGNYDGAAAAVRPDAGHCRRQPGAWIDFAIASLGRDPDDWSQRQQRPSATPPPARINAYLRADTVDDRPRRSPLLGDAFGAPRGVEARPTAPTAPASRWSTMPPVQRRLRPGDRRARLPHRLARSRCRRRRAAHLRRLLRRPAGLATRGLADFVTVDGGDGLAIEPEQRQICVDGVAAWRPLPDPRPRRPAGGRRRGRSPSRSNSTSTSATARPGSASPATPMCCRPAAAPRSRSSRSTPTRRSPTIYRIGDRGLAVAVRDGNFLRQLDRYRAESIGDETGEKVWEGEIEHPARAERDGHHRHPDRRRAHRRCEPGVYVITASAELPTANEWGQLATQWFVVSDLGLTALSGSDGIHAIVRSLATAEPVAGAKRPPRRRQQRRARRGDDRRRRLCPLRPGPCPRHRRHGAAAHRRRDRGGRLRLPRPHALGLRPDRPRRRRPPGARPARRLHDAPSAASTGPARPST